LKTSGLARKTQKVAFFDKNRVPVKTIQLDGMGIWRSASEIPVGISAASMRQIAPKFL
jgi:hypothetical protein